MQQKGQGQAKRTVPAKRIFSKPRTHGGRGGRRREKGRTLEGGKHRELSSPFLFLGPCLAHVFHLGFVSGFGSLCGFRFLYKRIILSSVTGSGTTRTATNDHTGILTVTYTLWLVIVSE